MRINVKGGRNESVEGGFNGDRGEYRVAGSKGNRMGLTKADRNGDLVKRGCRSTAETSTNVFKLLINYYTV